MNKKFIFSAVFALAMFLSAAFASQTFAQTVLVNYSFNDAVAGTTPCNPGTFDTAAGVTSTFTTSTGTCTTPGGNSTTANAFVQNSTAGQAVSITGFAAGSTQYFQFQLSNTSAYSSYQVYFQTARSGTGPTSATLQYSTDGTNFTDFQTVSPPATGNPLVLQDFRFDLSGVTALNGKPTVYFRIAASNGTSANGTFRIDNFQVQATTSATASGATISGRVTVSSGKGIPKARLTLTDSNGNAITTFTDRRGNFQFNEVPTGQTYVLSVKSTRNFEFAESTKVISLSEDLDGVNFVAN